MWNPIKQLFPVFDSHPDLVYLDNASTTQKPQSVIHAMSDYQIHSYANIHRGVYKLAEESERLYEDSKKKVAKFIWWDFREIVYTYNATYASNILAQSLVKTYNIWPGDTVILGIRDHHATIVPWQLLAKEYVFDIKFISIDKENLDIERESFSRMLSEDNVKVVVCSHVSNVTWIIYDVRRISTMIASHSEDIFFVVDWSQAVPHMRVNVSVVWCDAYFFTAHKMMGPTGVWVLWIKKDEARILHTTFWGWGIIESVTTDGCSLIRTADKFEPGTPNLIGIVGLSAAIDFYDTHDIYEYIHKHEIAFYDKIVDNLKDHSSLSVLWHNSSLWHIGIVSLVVDNPLELSEQLANHDICVRAWWHCAHPLLHHLWHERGTLRISPFIYNTMEDMNFLADVISDM